MTGFDQMFAPEPGGCWVVHYSDHSMCAVFPNELSALRFALERCATVTFVKWGEGAWGV